MAAGALAQSRADFAIALTGFCGPREKDEEVGLVYLACHTRRGGRTAQECHFGDIGREAVLDHAVAAALAMMSEAIVSADHPAVLDSARAARIKEIAMPVNGRELDPACREFFRAGRT